MGNWECKISRSLGSLRFLNLIPPWLRDVRALVRASGLLFADFLPAAWHVASVKPQGALCLGFRA